MSANEDFHQWTLRGPSSLRHLLPGWAKRLIVRLYWDLYDLRDYVAELTAHLPSHMLRLLIYRHLLGVTIGARASLHRGCRFYRPAGTFIGHNTVINRDVILDGRTGLNIGNNVSISEGVIFVTLEHDPQSATFENRGAPIWVQDHVFVGVRATILPGVTLGEGSIVGAGAIVTHDVEPYTIVAGVPARRIGTRTKGLTYVLDYRRFMG